MNLARKNITASVIEASIELGFGCWIGGFGAGWKNSLKIDLEILIIFEAPPSF